MSNDQSEIDALREVVVGRRKTMQTKHLIIICTVALIGLGIWRLTSPSNSVSPDGNHNTIVQAKLQYPKTVEFWKQWATDRKQHDDAVMPLKENEFVEHTLECAWWDDWLAERTLAIPQLGVDPQLTKLAVEFTTLYRDRAESWRYQAELMQVAMDIEARGDSGWTYVEAFIRGVLGDPFGVSIEMLEAESEWQEAAEGFLKYQRVVQTKYTDLRTRRDQLRARFISEYREELP